MNKCDMDSAMPDMVEDEIVELLGCKREEIIRASGKTGMGVEDILEAIIERIHEAEKYVPLDRLYLSPQCGFASCEIGNKLTEEQQWAKLKLVKEIAEEVWERKGKSSLLV